MTTDRLMGLLAFAVFVAFVGIVGISVKRIDLLIVIGIVVAMVGYDLWQQLKPRRR